jgi:magnesium transporter
MQTTEHEEQLEELQVLLDNKQIDALMERLEEMPAVEVAEFLQEQTIEDVVNLLRRFDPEVRGVLLSDFEWDMQYDLFTAMERREFATIFAHMYSDSRADFYQYLAREEQIEILPFLSKKIREDVISLSSYPPETAGGIMNTDFATILESMSIREAIEKIRWDAPSRKMLYYVYAVDSQMRMLGFMTLKDLILAKPDALVRDELRENFISAQVDEDRESVARKIEKYNLVAIPVLNAHEQLVGIVSHDDAIDVIRAEHTEDMEKFMGIVPDADGLGYMETPVLQHFRKRIFWLAGLAALGVISGLIIHQYEDALSALIILALYMPMMADTGGNTGSQAATVVIRAMALGEIDLSSWFRVLWKEVRVSLLIAACLCLLAFAKIFFLSYEADLPIQYTIMDVALVITLALGIQVITATLIGAALPLIVKKIGGDPAVAASPAITTVVDITGMLIYFGTATWFLL